MTNEEAIKEIEQSGLYGNQVHQETLELALSAIREKAERMSGCDFCLDPDGDNCNNNIYIDHTHRAAITTHDVYAPINFCPMCGRELKPKEAKS